MKKILLSLVCCAAAVLAPAVANAQSTAEPAADSAAVSAAEAPAEDGYKMTYVVSTQDEFLGLLEEAVRTEGEDLGVQIDALYAGTDLEKMISCIEAAKTAGQDAVLINLIQADDAAACIEAAGDMKVVFINRVPSDYSVLGDNAAAVASDEHLSGKYQGEFLADFFNKEGKTEVKYLLLKGTDGLIHTTLRTEGAIKAMEDAGITMTEAGVISADYDRIAAKEAMDGLLQEGLDADCIISNNDAMALGAILALKDADMDPASLPITGIDATADAVEAVKNGEMAMTVYQDANAQARQSILAAIDLLEGNPLTANEDRAVSEESDHVLYVPFVPVTNENVDTFKD